MKVMLTSAYAPGRALEALLSYAARDRFGTHSLTDNPSAADLILFVENAQYEDDPDYRRLRRHPLTSRYREKVFMYNETDRPWCVLPGLYCSMPRRALRRSRQRAFSYLYSVNPHIADPADEDADLLFSFIGTSSHRVRQEIFRLGDPDAHIEDSSDFSIWRPARQPEFEARQMRYASIIARSKFVLCPRGSGASSYRIYESMQAGRVPVVISDQWVEPEGPDWGRFLLRVPEAEVAEIPSLLRRHEPEFPARSRLSREAWEEWFAADVLFHRAVETCWAIRSARVVPERIAVLLPTPERYRVVARRRARQFAFWARSMPRFSRR